MRTGYGSALKEFLKNRDYENSSSDLNKLYSQYKSWDTFIEDAKRCGFKWSQIYFVTEILDLFKNDGSNNLKWLLLHIQHQYEAGNLRTNINSLNDDIKAWLPEDNLPISPNDFINSVKDVIKANSSMFGNGNEPFILKGDYIYINRIKKYEDRFLELLDIRLKTSTSIPNVIVEDEQRREIVEMAFRHNFLIISGGPGTGKTTTIKTIIKAFNLANIKNIALAAPTGRAAKRMMEGISGEFSLEAFTLHKLLGIIPNKREPRYNGKNHLQAEVVIVDEASMVDIHMMYRLFDALSPKTKLILVGDKDQLPSVEAGALLGDFLYEYNNPSQKMYDHISLLTKSYRSSDGIMDVAKVVISGESNRVLKLIKGESEDVKLSPIMDFDKTIQNIYKQFGLEVNNRGFSVMVRDYSSVLPQIEEYFDCFSSFTVLCPSRKGLYGTYSINNSLSKIINPRAVSFYHGQPIMITKNDYLNNLFNGDRGVVFNFTNGMYAFFKDGSTFKVVSISKIVDYETSYAGTVHKSQGSEFNRVCIIIPEGSERLLTREILYTALTRAKKEVLIYANDNEITTSVNKVIKRESGIREFLTN